MKREISLGQVHCQVNRFYQLTLSAFLAAFVAAGLAVFLSLSLSSESEESLSSSSDWEDGN